MRISDWSSDVCSSDLTGDWDRGACSRGEPGMPARHEILPQEPLGDDGQRLAPFLDAQLPPGAVHVLGDMDQHGLLAGVAAAPRRAFAGIAARPLRSEEHTSELQSLMGISYAVFCLKKKQKVIIYK